MAWYQTRWWYIERPFPWKVIGLAALVLASLAILAGTVLVVLV